MRDATKEGKRLDPWTVGLLCGRTSAILCVEFYYFHSVVLPELLTYVVRIGTNAEAKNWI